MLWIFAVYGKLVCGAVAVKVGSKICDQEFSGAFLFLLLVLTACSAATPETATGIELHPSSGAEVPQPTLVTSTGEPDEPDPATTSMTSTSSSSSPSTTTEIPDFGDLNKPCNGKIDFIFVIDRAHYMEPFWPRLNEAFPKFIDDVLETYDGFDMRFMTLDTMRDWGLPQCGELCSENNTCDPFGPTDYPCDGHNAITECDQTRGAGSIYPAGFDAANRDCGPVDGGRWVSTTQPDIADRAKCIGQVGYGTSSGWAYSDLAEALTPGTEGSLCNGHFLRDDAMLFFLWIERTQGGPPCSYGPPGAWADTVYKAKNWDKDKVVALGIIDHEPLADPQCFGGAECSKDFLSYYIKHRIIGTVCAESYTPYFEQSLDLLKSLCDPHDIPT